MTALRILFQRSLIFLRAYTISLVCAVTLLAGCAGAAPQVTTPTPTIPPAPTPPPLAEITFIAHLPDKLADGQNLYLELLDEVTGLAMNPKRAKMETQDHQNFGIKIPFPVGSVLKYRYVRDNDPLPTEYNSLNQQVRYRLYYVDGPGLVHDTVTGWKSQPATVALGRIRGQVANKANNAPVVNALVEAGGIQTLTASDGSFLLEGLPPGTHNLVVYAMDGAFVPFQQGAIVASDSTTPATIMLTPSKLVDVTFMVTPPKDSVQGTPIRMVGNILALGNTFADLEGGMSVVASRAPLLTVQPDGQYSLKIRLPAGLDLRYKYTLGDGFWNAEHASNGDLVVRQVIIPDKETTYRDTVDTWKTPGFGAVSFTVSVPKDTPPDNTVSIQFNPFGWTTSIPMWPVGSNKWSYVLYSPQDAFAGASYRYCRNDQCGTADAADTRGPSAKGHPFTPTSKEQTFVDRVDSWAWYDTSTGSVTVPSTQINAHTGFKAGAELMPGYKPSWQSYVNLGFQNLKDTGANSVILTPTWHVTRQDPPVLEPVTGQDPLWMDLTKMANQASQKGLEVTLHPVLVYSGDPAQWWQKAARDDGWWQTWFDRYRTFLLYNADLATQSGAKTLIIGDASLIPALPGGTLSDGSPSGVPADANQRWAQIISDLRGRYTGKIVWFMPDAGKMPPAPDFLSDVDMLYVQVSAPLTTTSAPNQSELETSLAKVLDSQVQTIQSKFTLPVMLGLQYPSVSGAFGNCVKAGDACLTPDAFNRPALDNAAVQLSLSEQADVYSAILNVINQRPWISGFYTVGYNPVVELRDPSNSVRSKPASDILWYWFPRLTGQK